MGLRGRLVSAGFRCGNPVAGKSYYDISVPLTFPCYYDVAGKDYTSMQDVIRSKPQLTKYFQGCLDLARTGGAYRTESDREAEARRPAAKRTVGNTQADGCHRRGEFHAAGRDALEAQGDAGADAGLEGPQGDAGRSLSCEAPAGACNLAVRPPDCACLL